MKIGRFIRSSRSVWKGRNACIVEVRGSVLRYPGFCRPEIIETDGPSIEESEILEYISSNTGTLEAVAIGGGEPLAQSDLYPFLKKLKKTGIPVLLITEGTDPDMLDDLVGALMVDRVVITAPSDRMIDPRTKRCIGIVKTSEMDFSIRTALIKGQDMKDHIIDLAHLAGEKGSLELCRFDPKTAHDPCIRDAVPKNKEVADIIASARQFCKKIELIDL